MNVYLAALEFAVRYHVSGVCERIEDRNKKKVREHAARHFRLEQAGVRNKVYINAKRITGIYSWNGHTPGALTA
jgi:hypothetical protein